jgi:hypothetical protein
MRVCSQCANDAEPRSALCEACEVEESMGKSLALALEQLHECALAEERMREIHSRIPEDEHIQPVFYGMCRGCGRLWPCPTRRALDGQ